MSSREDDLAVFTTLSAELQQSYAEEATDPWEASPFAWIKREPSRRVGAIGEGLVKAWARHEGIEVAAPTDTGHDCRLNGVPVEIKFSTLWAGGGFVFQQIRDQTYQVAALLGIEPQAVRLWMVPKGDLWVRAAGQHTGANAQDTKWLRFPAAAPPDWLTRFGGSLAGARRSLEEIQRNLGR
jgi:hypothetical protein